MAWDLFERVEQENSQLQDHRSQPAGLDLRQVGRGGGGKEPRLRRSPTKGRGHRPGRRRRSRGGVQFAGRRRMRPGRCPRLPRAVRPRSKGRPVSLPRLGRTRSRWTLLDVQATKLHLSAIGLQDILGSLSSSAPVVECTLEMKDEKGVPSAGRSSPRRHTGGSWTRTEESGG